MSLAAPALVASRPRSEALSYDLVPHALALAMFALCAFSPAIFNDGDTWSHIATGEWMFAHNAIPHADPFTFSVPGKPWIAHEWLSEILLALAYKAGGFVGVALLTGAAAGVAVFVVARAAARNLGGPALAAVGALAALLVAPSLLARPHILALPVFALWTDALLCARDRAPPIALTLMMTLWANLHGGFAVGLALIAPFAAEAVLAAPWTGAPPSHADGRCSRSPRSPPHSSIPSGSRGCFFRSGYLACMLWRKSANGDRRLSPIPTRLRL